MAQNMWSKAARLNLTEPLRVFGECDYSNLYFRPFNNGSVLMGVGPSLLQVPHFRIALL